ncbi:hypothetical protein XENORESO_010563 [Xenotaenia resolanae]|uniref:Uncharacterized protein n=1 Tax=Xenotaenia resolanae TaxID=208358 RepID=A0ABV0VSQ8_9TELE
MCAVGPAAQWDTSVVRLPYQFGSAPPRPVLKSKSVLKPARWNLPSQIHCGGYVVKPPPGLSSSNSWLRGGETSASAPVPERSSWMALRCGSSGGNIPEMKCGSSDGTCREAITE